MYTHTHYLFIGWSDATPDGSGGVDWEDDSATGWGVPRPGVRGLAPGTPGPGPVMGGVVYGDGRGLAPSTPGSAPGVRMLDQDNNGWGTLPIKSKVSLH